MAKRNHRYYVLLHFAIILAVTFTLIGCGGGTPKSPATTPGKGKVKKTAVIQKVSLVSDLIQGRKVFEDKNCSKCHSVFGQEEKVAPTLQTTRIRGSFLDIFSNIWNHAPAMAVQMRKEGLPRPQFGTSELNHVVSFIYMLPYLGKPGSKVQGEKLLEEKACLICHTIGGIGKKGGISLDVLAHYESQVVLAQRMWNHGPVMLSQMISTGTPVPKFSGNDMNDLFATLSSEGKNGKERKISLGVGDAEKGERIFKEKKCNACHSLFGQGGKEGPDLGKTISQANVASLTALLWNHAAEMQKTFREKKLPWPYFSETEMSDLVVFLYSLNYQEKNGDPKGGKKAFEKNTCADCHFQSDADKEKLVKRVSGLNPVQFATVLWNHIPKMEAKMVSQAVPWPRLSGKEMRDILAYFQSL